MASLSWGHPRAEVWRFSARDGMLVAMAGIHAVLLALWPVAPLIALGVWWNSNTVAHNFIHRPFFRSVRLNLLFSVALSLLLGIPQSLWRDRHLAHHAGVRWRLRPSAQLRVETALVLCLWAAMAAAAPRWFLLVYLPGYLAGLVLCALQGHWEHAAGAPTSHYGRLYNGLCFNDGYHAEHHADPSVHWTDLTHHRETGATVSNSPPLLRWLDTPWLEALEQMVLRSPLLQRFVLRCHRRAFAKLLARLPEIRTVAIVGGGLFPRTALILRDLLPSARLIAIDSSARNLATARALLDSIEYRHERFSPGLFPDCDLIVIPLCFEGDRAALYRHPPGRALMVHDWIWRRRGVSAMVSPALFKRINLVQL